MENKLTKDQIEKEFMLSSVPAQLELKKSSYAGLGLFARCNIPKGTKFVYKALQGISFDNDQMHNYTWNCGQLYPGIGYWCNGSCDWLLKTYPASSKVFEFWVIPYNVDYKQIDLTTLELTIIKDIEAGQELILNYGDNYFRHKIRKLSLAIKSKS